MRTFIGALLTGICIFRLAYGEELSGEIAASILKDLVNKKDGIKYWVIHPGGRKVLDKIKTVLSLQDSDLQYSRKILYNYGNMSSPAVLFVLKEIIPRPGDRVLMVSFGAGFSGYSALLEYR